MIIYKSDTFLSVFYYIIQNNKNMKVVILPKQAMRSKVIECRLVKRHPDYMVTCDGEVYKFNYKNRGKIGKIKQRLNQDGYYNVSIKDKSIGVHRVVANTFISNSQNKSEVDHINGIRTDNRVENLRWTTHKENCNNPITRARQSKRMTEHNPFRGKTHPQWFIDKQREHLIEMNLTGKKVYQYTMKGEYVAEYKSAREAQRQTGIDCSSISHCCRGDMKYTHGYVWSYTPIEFTEVAKANTKKICQLSLDGTLIKIWDSAAEAERCLGLFHANIANCCNGKTKTCGGFRWCYFSTFNQ